MTKNKVRKLKNSMLILALAFGLFSLSSVVFTRANTEDQAVDEEYTRLIKEATTKPEFLSPLVNYLPRAEGVPTPKDILGYIAGAPGKLTYYEDILKYLNVLAQMSPNVNVFPIGKTSEGREMVIAVVADSETLNNLDRYKRYLAGLADPCVVKTEEEADTLIAQAKPIFWLTGNLHSGESGAAEASMELVYRLAVDNSPMIKKIRENMIVLITPSVEPDGHDKHTDWFYKYNKELTEPDKISRVPFWGKYTFHDNNRDMISISQPETQNEAQIYFEWHPVVVQDNHESIPFLYVMSGTGPYNATYDPSLTSEWNLLAWWEVTRLTSYGMPGVWTHGFWDGWAPNYLFSVANNHNALGRFYETYGNSIGTTMKRELAGDRFGRTSRTWYMPMPPYKEVVWSMRNNLNYQISADISAFYFVASNKEYFLKNFWKRSFKSYEAGKNEPPYAYVIPSEQKDMLDAAYLINVLLRQKIEVHQAEESIKTEEGTFPKGSYVVRMDQPYRSLVLNLMGIQAYPKDAPVSYDDTGWTLGLHMDVKTVEIKDKSILDVPLTPVVSPVKVKGELVGGKAAGAYIINNGTINNLLCARLKLRDFQALAAEEPFKVGDREFGAGSMVIPVTRAPARIHQAVKAAAEEMGLTIFASPKVPEVKTHDLDLPRIAIYHTWMSTQDDGWVRFAFDQLGIPYAMIHKDHIRKGNLKARYDVIIFSNCRGRNGADIVNEIDPGERGPLAFVKSQEFKHLGTPDSSPDITGGMGIEGVASLQKFVEQGGRLLMLHNPVRVAVDYGMVRGVSIYNQSSNFYNPGSLLKAEVANPKHPLVYGYDKEIAVFRNGSGPLLNLSKDKEKYVVLRYAKTGRVCLSGLVKNDSEIRGKPAIIDLPVGKGRVVLFTFNPFWRDLSHGGYMFVFNAILNYNDF
ncbi:MAG: M14 family zinc carboxypeptidase [Candidatus Aminicenantales bacterium]